MRFDKRCAGVKGGHALAGLKQLYAAEFGLPLRTAQHHAKVGNPQWEQWVATQAGKAVTGKPGVKKEQVQALALHVDRPGGPLASRTVEGDEPPAMRKPAAERSPEEYAECEAWLGLVLANRQRVLKMEAGNALEAVAYVKIAGDALKAFHTARKERIRAEIESGRLKPMGAWVQAKTALKKIVALLERLESIAQEANPEKPLVARQAIQNWKLNVFVPQLESAMRELDREVAA